MYWACETSIRLFKVMDKFWAPAGLCLSKSVMPFHNNKLMRQWLKPHTYCVNTYELAKITQPIGGSLFRFVMADWLALTCHYICLFFPQQQKVFSQNFSQTRNSFANYSQIKVFGEWRMLSASLGCLLWVQRATYCVDLSILSFIKYLL